jgi:hypothetical protein
MLKVRIETKNDAFEDSPCAPYDECARILSEVATKLKNGINEGNLFDYNGNRVGSFKLTKR